MYSCHGILPPQGILRIAVFATMTMLQDISLLMIETNACFDLFLFGSVAMMRYC
jgi:hypothetical protein